MAAQRSCLRPLTSSVHCIADTPRVSWQTRGSGIKAHIGAQDAGGHGMQTHGFDIRLTEASSLHGMVHVEGWVRHPSDFITDVRPDTRRPTHIDAETQFPERGIVSADHALRFRCRFVIPRGADHLPVTLTFRSQRRQRFSVTLGDLVAEAQHDNPAHQLRDEFEQLLRQIGRARVLDVGGRDRSNIGYGAGLEQHETTVLDLYPGDGVDVVGDAHRLSEHFPVDRFDAITSTATFEHLFMPWKVVLEMNRVLKPGGLVFALTHQSIGMHDEPNDFWRYTQYGWAALFNEATGFEVIRSAMGNPMFLLPHLPFGASTDFFDAVGYYDCAVLARRTGKPTVAWQANPPDALRHSYPKE